jgi:hypothetical protein
MATGAWTANAVRTSASARVKGAPSSRSYRLGTPSTRPWASRGTLTWVVALGSGPPLPDGLARTIGPAGGRDRHGDALADCQP